jgi:hypothetical protein
MKWLRNFTENMGLEESVSANNAFRHWSHAWAKCAIIQAEEIKMTRTLAEELVHLQGSRVTYAPESTRRPSGHISLNRGSVPIQARQ